MSATTVGVDVPSGIAQAYGSARLFAGTGGGRVDLARHRAVHGAPRQIDHRRLASELEAVRLLGRGGAAFPIATKLRATPRGRGTTVVVNGSEGEPASQKDRTLMRLAPQLVLDGALVVARALYTQRVVVVVADQSAAESLRAAARERRDTRRVQVVAHDHGFVGGEVRAVVRALSDGPAVPPGRRVLPTVQGVGNRPTFASNVETFAHVGLLSILGVDEFGSVGAAAEPGTTLLTLLGDVPHPGVMEVPTGLPLDALVGAGHGPILVGGYHGTWLADAGSLTVSRPTLKQAGAPLNAGVIARLPVDTCALGEVAAVARYLADESAGQCGPCFFGLPALAHALEHLVAGYDALPDASRRVDLLPGRGACAHPDGSASFVGSALAVLGDEVGLHQRHGRCGRPVLGVLPVPARVGAAS